MLLTFVLVAITVAGPPVATRSSPRVPTRADLASPAQSLRDEAAAYLRVHYLPPSRAPWDSLLAHLKDGSSENHVAAQLEPFHVTPQGSVAGGGAHMETYRLDDEWVLRCDFTDSGNKLFHRELMRQVRDVWVEPPRGFTGAWTTYFANGQKSYAFHYKNGQYFGSSESFRPDGSKAVALNYGPHGPDGEEIGYFPSGKIAYRINRQEGDQLGGTTFYAEDGSIKSTPAPDSMRLQSGWDRIVLRADGEGTRVMVIDPRGAFAEIEGARKASTIWQCRTTTAQPSGSLAGLPTKGGGTVTVDRPSAGTWKIAVSNVIVNGNAQTVRAVLTVRAYVRDSLVTSATDARQLPAAQMAVWTLELEAKDAGRREELHLVRERIRSIHAGW